MLGIKVNLDGRVGSCVANELWLWMEMDGEGQFRGGCDVNTTLILL